MDYSSDIGKEASGSTFVMFDLRKENKPPHNLTVPEHLTSNLTRSVRPLPPLWFLLLAAANTAVAQPANTAGAQSERYRDFIRKGATRSDQDLDHDGQEAAAGDKTGDKTGDKAGAEQESDDAPQADAAASALVFLRKVCFLQRDQVKDGRHLTGDTDDLPLLLDVESIIVCPQVSTWKRPLIHEFLPQSQPPLRAELLDGSPETAELRSVITRPSVYEPPAEDPTADDPPAEDPPAEDSPQKPLSVESPSPIVKHSNRPVVQPVQQFEEELPSESDDDAAEQPWFFAIPPEAASSEASTVR